MDGCGRTGYKSENFDDEDGIFYLKSKFGVRRVRIALEGPQYIADGLAPVLAAQVGSLVQTDQTGPAGSFGPYP